jgi:tRNA1Val (adenine37-N6)-methyltransferase
MLETRATTIDTLLGERVRIEQFVKGYRSGIDPVLLAACVPAQENERALELGLGAGAASLCLLSRVPGVHVTGIESDPHYASLARRNTALNNIEDRLEVIEGKIGDDFNLKPFDHVFMNPPFHDTAQHGKDQSPSHMPKEELPLWIKYGFAHLKPRGTFTLIHRADALATILTELDALPAGAVKILPIAPHAGKPAKRIIVSAVKDRKSPLELLNPLVVHKADGTYDDACQTLLKDGQALQLRA